MGPVPTSAGAPFTTPRISACAKNSRKRSRSRPNQTSGWRRSGRTSKPLSRSRMWLAQLDLPNSPSLTMSIPVSCCFRTTSATAWRRVCSYAAASYAFPGALLFASATSSGGRVKLPTCVVRKRPWLRFMNRPPSLSPQLLTSDARPLHLRGQLRPNHLFVPHAGADAAVGAGLDVLAADALGVAHQPLGHQFGMLDEVGRVGDDARHQHPALRQPDLLPDVVLVVVAHVRRLNGVLPGLDRYQDVGDVLELDVVDVRR